MFTKLIGDVGRFLLNLLTAILGRTKINPNLLTLLGFAINIGAALAIAAEATYRSRHDAEFHARLFDELFREPRPFEEHLPGLPTPTLITWGERDRVLHASGARILHGLLPASELHLMPETGHVPMVEKPQDCATAFLNFQRGA